MLFSAFGFAVMATFVKIAGRQGVPLLEIIAARAAISLVLSYIDVKRKRIPLFGHNKLLLITRGLVGFFTLTGVYYALLHLPLAEATVLQYLHPLFTALLALLFLKEQPSAATLVCIVISLIGLVVMVHPGFVFGDLSGDLDLFAVAIAIAAAFGSGLAYTLVRKLSAHEDPSVIVFYFPLVCLPATFLLSAEPFVMPEGWTWASLLMVGIGTQIGQVCLTRAMQMETASRATSFSYTQVVFAAVFGIIVFDELPNWWTILGAGLIILGAMLNVLWQPARQTVIARNSG
ncbi:MAG: DMT family transporter [Gammaproteobacteria bacterium]